MHTTATTRNTPLRKDLEALIAWLTATNKADSLHDKLDRAKPDSYSAVADALFVALHAKKAWHQIPRKRRLRAENLHKTVLKTAESAFELGGSYSGETSRKINWEGPPAARTVRDKGERYCGSEWWCRTNATHTLDLDFDGVLAMERNAELLDQSAAEGLPIIALYRLKRRPHVYQAIWAQKGKGKTISTVNGWIAYDPTRNLMYHSTISAAYVWDKLVANIERMIEEHRHQEALSEVSPKMERRARLISKLCGEMYATIADARKLGYCHPGITAFRRLHGIGDSVSLPELVKSGNPLAIKLALYLARRVARNTTNSLTNSSVSI